MRDIQLTYQVNLLCREDTCSNLLCSRPHESVGDSQADVLTQAEQQGWNIQTVDGAIRAFCRDCTQAAFNYMMDNAMKEAK